MESSQSTPIPSFVCLRNSSGVTSVVCDETSIEGVSCKNVAEHVVSDLQGTLKRTREEGSLPDVVPKRIFQSEPGPSPSNTENLLMNGQHAPPPLDSEHRLFIRCLRPDLQHAVKSFRQGSKVTTIAPTVGYLPGTRGLVPVASCDSRFAKLHDCCMLSGGWVELEYDGCTVWQFIRIFDQSREHIYDPCALTIPASMPTHAPLMIEPIPLYPLSAADTPALCTRCGHTTHSREYCDAKFKVDGSRISTKKKPGVAMTKLRQTMSDIFKEGGEMSVYNGRGSSCSKCGFHGHTASSCLISMLCSPIKDWPEATAAQWHARGCDSRTLTEPQQKHIY